MFKRGFTLIELLVVIAIIGILAGIITASLSSAKIAARDAKRISDLNNIRLALSLYYNDNNKYPKNLNLLVPTYIPSKPKDPSGTDYKYTCLMTSTVLCGSGSRYHLGAIFESSTNTALADDSDWAANANGYRSASDSVADFDGVSTDCGGSASSPDYCYDLGGN
jgi:prepilin-type N-terminal cleavage/methylation domain-containing protein